MIGVISATKLWFCFTSDSSSALEKESISSTSCKTVGTLEEVNLIKFQRMRRSAEKKKQTYLVGVKGVNLSDPEWNTHPASFGVDDKWGLQ